MMKDLLKLGDKVRCVNDDKAWHLLAGEVYTVKSVCKDVITLKEIKTPHEYYDCRFEPIRDSVNLDAYSQQLFKQALSGSISQLAKIDLDAAKRLKVMYPELFK